MNNLKSIRNSVLFLMLLISISCSTGNNDTPRQKIKFDYGWSFSKGEFTDAYKNDFDDKEWKSLDLPHDWSITDTFSKKNPGSCAYATGGIGWYRKKFNTDNISKDSKVSIEFGGVYMNSEVWINGHYLGKRPYGYISFNYDLTPYLDYKGENVLAVKVDKSKQPSARWYTGSGIYRHVWLAVTEKLHVARHGIHAVAGYDSNKDADVRITTQIENEYDKNQGFTLQNDIYAADGTLVVSEKTADNLDPETSKKISQNLKFKNPELWSPASPYLYTLRTKIMQGDKMIDSIDTRIGIRNIKFTREKGFFLNGVNMKILGVNNHSDLGALGAALNEKVLIRRLKILKDMGCNAIRTAHNPPSEELLEL